MVDQPVEKTESVAAADEDSVSCRERLRRLGVAVNRLQMDPKTFELTFCFGAVAIYVAQGVGDEGDMGAAREEVADCVLQMTEILAPWIGGVRGEDERSGHSFDLALVDPRRADFSEHAGSMCPGARIPFITPASIRRIL